MYKKNRLSLVSVSILLQTVDKRFYRDLEEIRNNRREAYFFFVHEVAQLLLFNDGNLLLT